MKKREFLHRQESRAASPAVRIDALGQSEAFLEFQERLSRVAPIDRPVLLVGERGTGKELATTRLHFLSLRWKGPFVALNCSALAPSLIEAELFGYEKGAFTGALQQRTGRFEAANGGTLFLDEIGNIPLEVQEKILRVVEYGAFERVGSSVPVEVDVRITSATNADLKGLAENGRFKRDLLDRLSFEVLFLPPLRERKGDILLLANHFAHRMAFELRREEIPVFSSAAEDALEIYAWPGNIRELKNVVERAVYRSDSDVITDVEFDPFYRPPPDRCLAPAGDKETEPAVFAVSDFAGQPLKSAVKRLEIHLLKSALETARYNRKKAAESLGLTYDQFRGLCRKYGDEIE
ncbi:MAG: phage shock protein operon transcriptional activator [Pseudomonadota bacterium]